MMLTDGAACAWRVHALLRVPALSALLSHPQAGASWEAMVVEEILRQLNATGASFAYSYYRTGGGAVPRRYHNKIIGLPMAWL